MQITNVRYVKSTSGAKLRNDAAGSTIVKTLLTGDLMYDIPGVASVKKKLNGTSYTWIKVCAFTIVEYSNPQLPKEIHKKTVSYIGWIALETTTIVSRSAPSKSNVICTNSFLNQRKMLINARYIYHYLIQKNWKKNSIFALLGNMEVESTMNPGKWQGTEGNTSLGYGLTQWTPATKLIDWLGNKDKSDIDNQLNRILYESQNNLQWLIPSKTSYTPIKFSEFPTSSKSRDELTVQFFQCYEHNGKNEEADRITHAAKWDLLIGYLTD